MLASYGSNGTSGGAVSYGPGFWIVVAIVALVVIGLIVWRMARSRARRSGTPASSERGSDRQDRAA